MNNLFRASQGRNEAQQLCATTSMESALTMSLKAQPCSNSKRLFRCSITTCKMTFLYQSELNRHILTHSNTRPYMCEYPDCGKGFKRADTLQTHLRIHTGEKPFVCDHPVCKMGFSTKAALRYHSLKHSNEKVFKCEVSECGKSFLTLGQLKQHEKGKCHCAKTAFTDIHSGSPSLLTKLTSASQMHFSSISQPSTNMIQSGPVSTTYSDDGSEPGVVKKVKILLDENIFLA